jgi:hypothetical protein
MVEKSVLGRAAQSRRAYRKTTLKIGCYNQRGGGNSSTGRAPDCGSDGCGFDSRFPPQILLLNLISVLLPEP